MLKIRPLALLVGVLVWGSCTKKQGDDQEGPFHEDLKMVSVDTEVHGLEAKFKSFYLGELLAFRLCQVEPGQLSCDNDWQDAPEGSPFELAYRFAEPGHFTMMLEGQFASGNILQDYAPYEVKVDGSSGAPSNDQKEDDLTDQNGDGTTQEAPKEAGDQAGHQGGSTEQPPVEGTPTSDETPSVEAPDAPQTPLTSEGSQQEVPQFEVGLYQDDQLSFYQNRQYLVRDAEVRLRINLPDGVRFASSRLKVGGFAVMLCPDEGASCNGQFAGTLETILNRDHMVRDGETPITLYYTPEGFDEEYTFDLSVFMDATVPAQPQHDELRLKEDAEGSLSFHWTPSLSSETAPPIASYAFKSCDDTKCQTCDEQIQKVTEKDGRYALPLEEQPRPVLCAAAIDRAGNASAWQTYIRSIQIQHEELTSHFFLNRAPLLSKGQTIPLLMDFTFHLNNKLSALPEATQVSGMKILPNTFDDQTKVYVGLYDPPAQVAANAQIRMAHLHAPEQTVKVVEGFCDHPKGCRINLDDWNPDEVFLLSGYEFRLRGLVQRPTGAHIKEVEGVLSVNFETVTRDPFYYKVVYTALPKALVEESSSRRAEVNVKGLSTYDRAALFHKEGKGLIRGFSLTFASGGDAFQTSGSVDRVDLVHLVETQKPRPMATVKEALAFDLPIPTPPESVTWDRTMTYDSTTIKGTAGASQPRFLVKTCERDDCRCDTKPKIISDLTAGLTLHNLQAPNPLNACVAAAYDEQGYYTSTFKVSNNAYDGLMKVEGKFSGDELILNELPQVDGNLRVAFFGNAQCQGTAYEEEVFSKGQLASNLITKRFKTQLLHHNAMVYACFKIVKPDGESLHWRRVAEPRQIKRQICTFSRTGFAGESACVQSFGQVIDMRGKINSIRLEGNVCADIYGWAGDLRNPRRIQRVMAASGDIPQYDRDYVYWAQMVPCGLSRAQINGLGYARALDLHMPYSNWFSEEHSGHHNCKADEAVIGVQCSGRYCDSLKVRCAKLKNSPQNIKTETSNWFSEENPINTKDDMHVTGIRCSGRYCDNLQITWKRFSDPGLRKTGQCYETHSFSEEQGSNGGQCDFLKGYTVSGIKCSGRYCDNKVVRCCR